MKHLMKKAVKAAVFAALTTLALTAFASAEGEMAIGAGCTTGTSLRMRSEPNTSSAIVTTLNKSVAVALLDDSVPGWYKINYNGSTGYVSSDYLIIDQDIIFTTYSGLRISSKALYHEQNIPGVYVLDKTTVRFKPVEIIKDNGNFILCEPRTGTDDAHTLNRLDLVIIESGGIEMKDGNSLDEDTVKGVESNNATG